MLCSNIALLLAQTAALLNFATLKFETNMNSFKRKQGIRFNAVQPTLKLFST